MSNNSNISPGWAGFRKLWILVAIILFVLLVILMLAGYSPWGTKCDVPPTIIEKVVEKEKLVDNPKLLTRIGLLEKENAQIAALKQENTQIAGLKTNIADLTKSTGLVAGLQAKVKALEAIDLNFENPALTSRINLLEAENASIADMKKRIIELEALEATNAKSNSDNSMTLTKRIAELESENGLIAGLKAKVSALEAVDVNFIKPQDNSKLLQKINNLEVKTLAIPSLESRIKSLLVEKPVLTKRIDDLENENSLIVGLKAKVKALEAVDINFMKPKDDSNLMKRIGELETQNGLIPGLKAKISALEAVDVNFIKPQDNSKLFQKINNLEIKTLTIPSLESRIKALQVEKPILTKRIGDLETQNGLIPGLKAKIKALEAIDINFEGNGSSNSGASMMSVPNTAKLYFDPGRSTYPTDVNQSMAAVIVYLRANPNSTVSLAGFHDAVGSADWNRRLSAKRSNRVKQTLVDAGISSNQINVEIPTQTLGTGLPKEARRVEVTISK